VAGGFQWFTGMMFGGLPFDQQKKWTLAGNKGDNFSFISCNLFLVLSVTP